MGSPCPDAKRARSVTFGVRPIPAALQSKVSPFMKKLIATAALVALTALSPSVHAAEDGALHRFLGERTFPAGALAGVNESVKQKVNPNNSKRNVSWVMSYMDKEQTKTYCVYQAPSAEAVREVAKMNGLPVDSITEIPQTLMP